jgi:Flp pilus assembly protein TadD
MKNRILILSLAFFMSVTVSFSQEDGKVNSTISEVGMYNGTNSKKARAYFDEAADLEKKQKFNKAKKLYIKAIKHDNKFVEAYDNLGLIYRRLGDYDNAVVNYKKSIKLYPDGTFAHQNLAVVFGILKKYEEAVKEYSEISRIDSNNAEGYFGMANTYLSLSKFDDALVNAKKALDIYKKTKSAHVGDGYYMVGLANYYLNDMPEAKKYLQYAKNNGVRINSQIDQEVFRKEEAKPAGLKTKEDYVKTEQKFLDGYKWLMANPVGTDEAKRKSTNGFLMLWMTGSPYVSIELSDKIVTYMDCGDCMMMFMSGWTAYAIESKDFKGKFKATMAGTESAIKFYLLNKEALGKNKELDKLVELQKNNKLEDFVKKNI